MEIWEGSKLVSQTKLSSVSDSADNLLNDIPDSSTKDAPASFCLNDFYSTPKKIFSFFDRLTTTFGARYIVFVCMVYGVNQGIGETWADVAGNFYFSDPKSKGGLNLNEQRAQKILGFAHVPWEIKSIYGIISDLFPIRGLKRQPYILIAGIIGFFSFICLAITPFTDGLLWLLGIYLFSASFSMASPDVMIDATIAEKSRDFPEFTSDLQTLCWSMFAVGALLSSITGGWLYDLISSAGMFAVTSITSLAIIIPSVLGWLDESTCIDPKELEYMHGPLLHNTSPFEKIKAALQDEEKGSVIKLSFAFLAMSLSLGALGEMNVKTSYLVSLTAVVTLLVCGLVWHFEKRISPALAKASIYIFLSSAVQPSSVILTYWLRDVYSQCSPSDPEFNLHKTPCFSAEFLTSLNAVGNVCFLFGTAIYNTHFSTMNYQKIYFISQVSLFLCGFLDLVLVSRLNLTFGIPDWLFLLGDEVISDVIRRLNTMPFFMLAASSCPPGIEATLFAFNMGISNFGGMVGEYFGMGMLDALNLSHETGFVNLKTYILLRTLCKLLPLAMIPFLLPEGTPQESLLR